MKTMLLAAMLALPLIGNAQVSMKTDKFTGKVTYQTKFVPKINIPLRPEVLVVVNKDGSVESVEILLIGGYNNWKYLQCNATHWLLDGKPPVVPAAKHDGRILSSGGVIEIIDQRLSEDSLREFVAANKIEYEVCNDAGEFTPHELQDLRDLVSKLPSQ